VNKHRLAVLLTLVALLAWRQAALGLATEHFGNTPVAPGFITSTPDLLSVLNDPSRVYWYEVNGDACFFYQGNTGTLNAILKRLAAGGKGRELVLHAGPLKRASLGGRRPVMAQWYVHVPGGISLSHHADGGLVTDTLPAIHVHLPAARVRSPAPAARIAGWIKDLDSDELQVRESASRELDSQGQAAEAALRQALATTTSPEVKKRVRALLARLPEINLDALRIPEGLAVIGPDDLVSRCLKGLQSKDTVIRGVAATQLAGLEPDRKKAVAGLVKVLKEDKNEYVRRSVAGALFREGWLARSALPELRKLADDPDVNVKNAVRQAVEAIEKAKEEPGWKEQARLAAAVRKDIAAFLKERAARKGP
jgi:hypothetical protein